jgi:hypothetical protein
MNGQNYEPTSELLDVLAEAYLRAEVLASRSPEYEALAEAVGYVVDLADMALQAEAQEFRPRVTYSSSGRPDEGLRRSGFQGSYRRLGPPRRREAAHRLQRRFPDRSLT